MYTNSYMYNLNACRYLQCEMDISPIVIHKSIQITDICISNSDISISNRGISIYIKIQISLSVNTDISILNTDICKMGKFEIPNGLP